MGDQRDPISNQGASAKPEYRMPWLYAGIVFLILLMSTLYIAYRQHVASKEKEHQVLLRELSNVQQKFLNILYNNITAANSLAIIYKEFGLTANYDSICRQIMAKSKYVEALQITRNGVITYVYPSEVYKNTLGINTYTDSLRRAEELRAIQKGEAFFAGPRKLRMGGVGILCKVPIIEKNRSASVAVVLTRMPVIQAALFSGNNLDYRFSYSLSKKNGRDTSRYSLSYLKPGGEEVSVEIPQGDWILHVAYSTVYVSESYSWIFLITGSLLALCASLFAYLKTREPYFLKRELVKATGELMENEQKYRYLFDNSPAIVIIWDPKQLSVLEVNLQAIASYGYARNEFVGMPVTNYTPEEDRPKIKDFARQILLGNEADRRSVWRHYKKSGDLAYVDVSSHRIEYGGYVAVLSLGKDITEQYKAEEQLKKNNEDIRRLNKHLHNIREEERSSIAREIHDELGQQLTGLKMDVSWISKKLPEQQESLNEKVKETISLIDETISTVRRISSDLRPGILDDFGLVAALEWQSVEFEKRSGIKCTFTSSFAELDLPREIATCAFRVYQESLTNIMRHSGATEVTASISLKGQEMILLVKDNGRGFDTLAKRKTLGIIGMKERTTMLGGHLEIISNLGLGTTVALSMPIVHTTT